MSAIVRPRGVHGQNGPVSNGDLLKELRRQVGEAERLFNRLEALREYATKTTQELQEAKGLKKHKLRVLEEIIRTAELGTGQRRRKTA